MRKLKIGLILDDSLDTPDGVQQYVLAIGNWLTHQGNEVHYLVGETNRSDVKHVHSLSRNFNVRFNGNRLSLPLPAKHSRLRQLLETEQFDVLHVQMPYSPMLAQRLILAAPKQTVIVGTFHVLPYSRMVGVANRLLARWVRPSLKRFDTIFANTVATRQFIQQIYGRNVSVLPMVIDVDRFAKAESLPNYGDSKLTIMFLGRLVPRKGCMTLLEAVRILKQRNNLPPFRVVICGKGPLDAELKQYTADQLLEELVTFVGFIAEEDKPSYVASADIMAFPSTGGESFGIVLIEAMAGGAVTLAGDNPGYRSVLEPRPELLFPADDPFELAKKLSVYLRDGGARAEVQAWQKRYVHQFDVAVVGAQLLETYRQLLRKK